MGRSRTLPYPNPRRRVEQVRALYEEAGEAIRSEGRHWYFREHKDALRLANCTRHPLHVVCACLAVLSPRCQWRRAKRACHELLEGRDPPGIFGHNLAKARTILVSGATDLISPKTAPKTWAFWQNLWRPDDPEPVTIDGWMFQAHSLPPGAGLSVYRQLAAAYRTAAQELGLIPNQIQAAIWLHAKASHTRNAA